jgi:hypothetical protein
LIAFRSQRGCNPRLWLVGFCCGLAGLALHLLLWIAVERYRYSLGLAIPSQLTDALGGFRGYHETANLPAMLEESSLVFAGLVWFLVSAALAVLWVCLRRRSRRG